MPRATSNCEYCGSPMTYLTSAFAGGRRRWCSRQCQFDATHTKTTCPFCGKEFYCYKSWPRKFCSRRCSSKVNVTNIAHFMPAAVMIACDECGKSSSRSKNQAIKTERHFCSRACFGRFLSRTKTGVPRPEIRGEKPQLQKRVTLTCPVCHREFKVKESQASRRHFCSKGCMAEWQRSEAASGSNHPSWKGGYEPYYGPNWPQQRRSARHRDRYTCQQCGITETELGKQLDVHHKEPFSSFGLQRYREANRLSNLISYCSPCHLKMEHRQGNRPNPPSLLPRTQTSSMAPGLSASDAFRCRRARPRGLSSLGASGSSANGTARTSGPSGTGLGSGMGRSTGFTGSAGGG
jgi:5-methylcytosine-specific restriction endonuclease McrA